MATTLNKHGLSVVESKLDPMPRHNPWRAMRDHPDWRIHFCSELPFGAHGWTRWSDRTVWLVEGLSQVERRCALEHERQHILRGPDGQGDCEESIVEQATAHQLIPINELIDAVRWSRSEREVADSLNVTVDVLVCRLRHLHPSERAALAAAMVHHQVA